MTVKEQLVKLTSQGGPEGGLSKTWYLSGPYTFQWQLTTGGRPYRGVLYVDQTVDADLIANKWHSLRFSLTFGFGGKEQTFTDLFAIRRGRISRGGFVGYTFVDRRYILSNAMVDSTFNALRVQNGFIRPSGFLVPNNIGLFEQVRMESFVGFTLKQPNANEFASVWTGDEQPVPWSAFEALKYLISGRYFAIFSAAQQTAIASVDPDPNKRPGNNIKLFAPDANAFRFEEPEILGATDNRYILKNWNPRARWPVAIDQLQRLAHVVVFLKPDGKIAITSSDPGAADDLLRDYGWYMGGGGIPNVSENNYEAPRTYRVFFTTRREHRVEHDEYFDRTRVHIDPALVSGPQQPSNNVGPQLPSRLNPQSPVRNLFDRRVPQNVPKDVFWLEQVFRMPQDAGGLQKGQFACVQDAFDAWNSEKNILPVESFQQLDYPFSYDTLYKFPPWASTALASTVLRDRTRIDFRNKVLEARVSTMYDTRKTLRIPDVMLESIANVSIELSSIFATSTRSRITSPVWCDYVTWDSVINRTRSDFSNIVTGEPGYGYIRNNPLHDPRLYPKLRKTTAGVPDPEEVTRLQKQSPNSYPVTNVFQRDPDIPPSPFQLSVVDGGRGVFQLTTPEDLSGEINRYYLGLADPDTIPLRTIGGLSATGNPLVTGIKMVPIFRMFTIIAIVWRTPNHVRRSYYQEIDGRNVLAGASGPLFERHYHGYEAYQVYEPGDRPEWRESGQQGQLFIDHPGGIGNADVLADIARGEAYQTYYSFRPRIIGTYSVPGVDIDFPAGHISATAITARQGHVESSIIAERPPKLPNVVAGYEPNVKDIIQKLPKGSNDG